MQFNGHFIPVKPVTGMHKIPRLIRNLRPLHFCMLHAVGSKITAGIKPENVFSHPDPSHPFPLSFPQQNRIFSGQIHQCGGHGAACAAIDDQIDL